MDQVYNLALDGNIQAALDRLYSIDPSILSPTEQQIRQKYLDRFGLGISTTARGEPTLLSEIKGAFQDYWDRALLQKMSQKEGNKYLFSRLVPIAENLGEKPAEYSDGEFERVATFLIANLRETGLFSKIGTVSPHMNFMAWKKERTQTYSVDLGGGELQTVNVVLMEDFESLGWAAYATFDKFHVGGWVGEKSLHCVASSYDLESENFKVSFLAHEARHFTDLKSFPKLKSLDLEYRAKLNELILAQNSFSALLKKFMLEQRENPTNPHSYASFLMLNRLSEKLMKPITLESFSSFDTEKSRKYARELLNEHTNLLRKNDPKLVETVLP